MAEETRLFNFPESIQHTALHYGVQSHTAPIAATPQPFPAPSTDDPYVSTSDPAFDRERARQFQLWNDNLRARALQGRGGLDGDFAMSSPAFAGHDGGVPVVPRNVEVRNTANLTTVKESRSVSRSNSCRVIQKTKSAMDRDTRSGRNSKEGSLRGSGIGFRSSSLENINLSRQGSGKNLVVTVKRHDEGSPSTEPRELPKDRNEEDDERALSAVVEVTDAAEQDSLNVNVSDTEGKGKSIGQAELSAGKSSGSSPTVAAANFSEQSGNHTERSMNHADNVDEKGLTGLLARSASVKKVKEGLRKMTDKLHITEPKK